MEDAVSGEDGMEMELFNQGFLASMGGLSGGKCLAGSWCYASTSGNVGMGMGMRVSGSGSGSGSESTGWVRNVAVNVSLRRTLLLVAVNK